MKYNDNGTYKDIYVKAFDTLPVGTEVDYDGETVPTGWAQIAEIDSNNSSHIAFTTTTPTEGYYDYVKYGRVVTLSFSAKINTTVSGNWKSLVLTTLPDKLKPYQICQCVVIRDSSSSIYYILIKENGELTLTDKGRGNITASAESIAGTITYISAE